MKYIKKLKYNSKKYKYLTAKYKYFYLILKIQVSKSNSSKSEFAYMEGLVYII